MQLAELLHGLDGQRGGLGEDHVGSAQLAQSGKISDRTYLANHDKFGLAG